MIRRLVFESSVNVVGLCTDAVCLCMCVCLECVMLVYIVFSQ